MVAEVNRPHLTPHGQLVTFAAVGLALVFLTARPEGSARWLAWADFGLALLTLGMGVYLLLQTEPVFESLTEHVSGSPWT